MMVYGWAQNIYLGLLHSIRSYDFLVILYVIPSLSYMELSLWRMKYITHAHTYMYL